MTAAFERFKKKGTTKEALMGGFRYLIKGRSSGYRICPLREPQWPILYKLSMELFRKRGFTGLPDYFPIQQ